MRQKNRKLNILFFLFLVGFFFEFPSRAENFSFSAEIPELIIFQENTLFSLPNSDQSSLKVIFKLPAIITAYSSNFWETDNDPYITAKGTKVREGIVANNYLPLGTKIKIPEIFGNKIFVVEDRMHWKKSNYQFDIWFENYWEALNFGVKETYVEILE